MSDTTPPVPSTTNSSDEDMFPTLTASQIARITAHGHTRYVQPGEVLVEAGSPTSRLFVVISGQIEIVQLKDETEEIVAVFRPGTLTRPPPMPYGRRGLAHIRARDAGEATAVDREQL